MENSTTKSIVYGVGVLIVLVAIGFYTYHIWSDCLAENSVFTCYRMLSK